MKILSYARALPSAVRLYEDGGFFGWWALCAAADRQVRADEDAALAAFEADELRFWKSDETGQPVAREAPPSTGPVGQIHTVEMRIIAIDHLDDDGRPPLTRELAQAMDAEEAGGPPVVIVHTGADDSWADTLRTVRLDIDEDQRIAPGIPEVTSDSLSEDEIEQAREDAEWAAAWRQFDQRFADGIAELERWMAGEMGRKMYRLFSELRVRDYRIAERAGEVATATITRPVPRRLHPRPAAKTSPKRIRQRANRQLGMEAFAA